MQNAAADIETKNIDQGFFLIFTSGMRRRISPSYP